MWTDVIYVILMVLFLLVMGGVIASTVAERQPLGARADVYISNFFVKMLTLFWIPMLVLFVVLLIMNWKITLITIVPFWLIGGPILKKISELLIIYPLYLYLQNKIKKT